MAKIKIEESKLMAMLMSAYLDGNLNDGQYGDPEILEYAKSAMAKSGLIKTDLVIPWELLDDKMQYASQDSDGEINIYERQPSFADGMWGYGGDTIRYAQHIKGVIHSNKPSNETLVERPVKE